MPNEPIFGSSPEEASANHRAPVFSSPETARSLKWDAILDQLPYGLVILGPEQQVRHENATCRHLLGFGVVEKGGLEGWLGAVCPDPTHREKVISSWREHIWRNQLTRTFTLKTSEQKLREIEFRSSLLQDGGITLTIEDVTEATRMEETMRHGKLKFRALFSHSETGTVLVDRTGRIIDANPSFLAFTGISLKDLRLSTLSELLHPHDAEALSVNESESIRREVRVRARESEKRSLLTYVPIGEPGDPPALGIYLFSIPGSGENETKLAARLQCVAMKAQALLQAVPDLILLIDEDVLVMDFAPPPRKWSEIEPDDSWISKPLSHLRGPYSETSSRNAGTNSQRRDGQPMRTYEIRNGMGSSLR